MSQEPDQDKKDAPTETVRAGKRREGDPGSADAGDTGTKVGRGGVDEKTTSS